MSGKRTICVIDDEPDVRESLGLLLQRRGYQVLAFASARSFLKADIQPGEHCLLADVRMPEMNGLELLSQVKRTMPGLPVIMMTGHGDVPMAVQAMKTGAVDFLEKPFEKNALFRAIELAFASRNTSSSTRLQPHKALTKRETQVFELLVEGLQNKVIAHRLGISSRTVEVHRARVMEKLGATNLAELIRHSMTLARS